MEKPIEKLISDRLILRKIGPAEMDFVFQNYSDEALMRFLGLSNPETLLKERNKWQKSLTTFNKSFLYFHLLENSTEKLIGWCGFHTWYTDHHRAELGYGLFEERVKNKGLMTEALAPILEYGWNKMNLHRIEAFVSSENLPSLKLLEKFGFQQEGNLKEHYLKDGIYEDSLVFALLSKYPSSKR